MKKLLLAGSILALAFSSGFAAKYNIDQAHSSVSFQVTHLKISDVDGLFNAFTGMVDFDDASKTLKALSGEVQVASLDTKNDSRDKHLNNEDFFNSAAFPKATFVMKSIKGKKLTADVTIRGITKEVVFDAVVNGPITHPMSKKPTIGIKIEGKLNRKDFGVGVDTADILVGDNVLVRISLEANR